MISRYERGQIWLIKTYIAKFDRVFSGEHFALILGVNDEKTLTVVPATSKFNTENKLLTSVELELVNLDGVKTVGHFIPNMIQTIDVKKTCSYVGKLDELSVIEVQKAVGKYLGFDTIKFEENAKKRENSEEERAFVKVETKAEQTPIKVTSNIGRPSKLLPKVGDIKYVNGKKYECIIDGKKAYGGCVSKWPKDILDNMVKDFRNGSSKAAIAYQYGISGHAVGDYLKTRGF
jgi:mRNA-degrading endonuclease toxin of MazEF toxin-antitoxin module